MDEMGGFISIVRMDVEGAEWEVLENWVDEGLFDNIGQLLMEVHNFVRFDGEKEEEHREIFSRLPWIDFFSFERNWYGAHRVAEVGLLFNNQQKSRQQALYLFDDYY